jgi:hypothetical protein
MRVASVLLAAACVCAFALSGCGASTKPTPAARRATRATSSTPATSFQSRADAICVNAGKRTYGSSHESAEATPLSKVASERARTADELARLKPPLALSAAYRRLIALMRREAKLLKRLAHNDDRDLLRTMRALRDSPLAKQALLLNVTSCV